MITSDQLKDAQDRVEALHRYLDIDAKVMQLEEDAWHFHDSQAAYGFLCSQ